MRQRKIEKLKGLISEMGQVEAYTDWTVGLLNSSTDPRLQALGGHLEPAGSMLFAAGMQLTSDLYDEAKVLVPRVNYIVEDQVEGEEGPFLLSVITGMSETAAKISKRLSRLTRWEGQSERFLTPELMRPPAGKMKAAYFQIDNAKSALAVTLAGYEYLELFDKDGEVIEYQESPTSHDAGYV